MSSTIVYSKIETTEDPIRDFFCGCWKTFLEFFKKV